MIAKNEIFDVTIDSINSAGFGVCRIDGIVCFVSDAVGGDKLKIKIIKTKKNYCIGKIEEILMPSNIRIQNDCPVFSSCGGCVYRHIHYDAECDIKYNQVKDAFKRIAHIDIQPEPILTAESIDGYRNKAQYPVADDGTLKIGFFSPRSHHVVDCTNCHLQNKDFSIILQDIKKWIKKYNISAYDENTQKGILRHIYLRTAEATGEIMVCLVINASSLPHSEALIAMLTEKFDTIKSIAININKEKTNVILGNVTKLLWGQEHITDVLYNTKVQISPNAFYQVNRRQAERLYQKAQEYAAVNKDTVLLDLYCGAGTIGLSMAKNVKELIGVEIVEDAINNAKQNAAINDIKNARFICGDAEKAAKILLDEAITPDVIIVDPPRKGCSEDLLHTITSMNPKRIVYVSCDCATLARDCEILEKLHYKVQEVTPVDLFPRTAHVETVVKMSRVEK